MKPVLCLISLSIVFSIAVHDQPVLAADSPLAVELDVPARDYIEHTLRYRLVGTAWLRYLRVDPRPCIWLKLVGLPESFNGLDLSGYKKDQNDDDFVYNDAKISILSLAEHILRIYLHRGMELKRTVVIHTDDSVDEHGTKIDLLPKGLPGPMDLREFQFNRTILIDFREPPYGQSKSNLLVTNKNIPWHDLNFRRYKLTNNFTRIDTTDLRYRYFHNIGHSLGLGHFVGEFERNDVGGLSTSSSSAPIKISPPYKSVMTADTTDSVRASQFATRQDLRVLGFIWRNFDDLVVRSIELNAIRRAVNETVQLIREAHTTQNG